MGGFDVEDLLLFLRFHSREHRNAEDLHEVAVIVDAGGPRD